MQAPAAEVAALPAATRTRAEHLFATPAGANPALAANVTRDA